MRRCAELAPNNERTQHHGNLVLREALDYLAEMETLTPKQKANRKARALESIAASVDKQARLAPKIDAAGLHKIADNLRARASSLVEEEAGRAAKAER